MGLGYINHDLTLMKNFSLGDGRNLQVRAEAYNVFNTTQYQGVNTTADVRLRDRRADEPGLRLDQRRPRQLEPRDPARRPIHVLIAVQEVHGAQRDSTLLNAPRTC